MKGMAGAQLHEILIRLIDTELDKALFELNLLSKWENEQCRREMREHVFSIDLSNCNSIKI